MTECERDDIALIERAGDADLLPLVEEWARVNSGSRNLIGLEAMAAELSEAFSCLPGEIRHAEPDPVTAMDGDGREVPLNHGKHFHLTVRPDAPMQVLLTGHMDTVFPADSAFQGLEWMDDDVLNGPGVADMKGGLALMLQALKAVEDSPFAKNLGYEVVINSDEEIGSASSASLLAGAARGKIAALTYEPALADGTLAGARGGSGNFSLHVAGRSAHAGRNPEDGRNAVVAAADIALRLAALRARGISCNPAKIEGGGANNVVPDSAVLRVNFRPRSPDQQIEIEAEMAEIITAVSAQHDVTVHRHGGFGRPPKPIDTGAQRLFGLVKKCGDALGLPISWRSTGGVCDGNNIAACGVPVVDTMGARGGDIHSDKEFLIVSSLPERARLSALTLAHLASGRW